MAELTWLNHRGVTQRIKLGQSQNPQFSTEEFIPGLGTRTSFQVLQQVPSQEKIKGKIYQVQGTRFKDFLVFKIEEREVEISRKNEF